MKCYRQGGCGPYEMLSCNECPASKPEYLKKADTAHWIWDPNGTDWGIGAWRCSKCQAINQNIGYNSKINPMNYTGSKYCPNCGLKMFK